MQVSINDFENRRDTVFKAVTELVGTRELSEQRSVSVFKVTLHAAPLHIGSSDVAGLKLHKLGEKEIKKRGKGKRICTWLDDRRKHKNVNILRYKIFKIPYTSSRICKLLRN